MKLGKSKYKIMSREVVRLIENFEVKRVYENRMHEHHHFSCKINGKEFKGSYEDHKITWYYPHPKQVVNKEQMEFIESEVDQKLTDENVIQDEEGIEVKPFLNKYNREAYEVKLTVEEEEFRGMVEEEDVKWFHPKPERKLTEPRIKTMEKQVQEKVKSHLRD